MNTTTTAPSPAASVAPPAPRPARDLVRAAGSVALTPLICAKLRGFDPAPGPGPLVDGVMGMMGGRFRALQRRGEIVGLIGRVQELRPRRVVEIGTCRGGTLLMFARSSAPDATLVSVDLPRGPWGGGYPWYRRPWYRAFAGPGQRIELLRRNSHDEATRDRVRDLLGGEPIDLLFIDGDHTYEGARRDFELYSPLVRPGGLIGLHDINPGPETEAQDCLVPKLWAELKAGRRTEEFIDEPDNAYGIGLIFA